MNEVAFDCTFPSAEKYTRPTLNRRSKVITPILEFQITTTE